MYEKVKSIHKKVEQEVISKSYEGSSSSSEAKEQTLEFSAPINPPAPAEPDKKAKIAEDEDFEDFTEAGQPTRQESPPTLEVPYPSKAGESDIGEKLKIEVKEIPKERKRKSLKMMILMIFSLQ